MPQKLSRLPRGTRIEKRPLIHPAIPSLYAGSNAQKIVYFSTKTPFMSAFKRVKKLLSQVEKRQMQSEVTQQRKSRGRRAPAPSSAAKINERVIVKATGKAIDRALQLALFLKQQDDLQVNIHTGSVTAIDDIVEGDGTEMNDGDEELPESRIRQTSTVEIGVTLKT